MNECYCCKKEFPERLETLREMKYVGRDNTVTRAVCKKCDHTESGKILQAMEQGKSDDASA